MWSKFPVDFTFMHTQKNEAGVLSSNCSTIDHFICNPELCDNCEDGGVLHFPETLEGHSPIYLKLKT